MRVTNGHLSIFSWCAALLALLSGNGSLVLPSPVFAQDVEEAGDPSEIVIGERLFLETRFAQFFKQFMDHGGGTNRPLPAGDPVMNTTVTLGEPLPGPFAGLSMNCRACHFHDQPFKFGQEELQGLKIFFAESPHLPSHSESPRRGNIGNCIACHQAPAFTDFRFHNTGTTQAEYDRIHGSGTFAYLPIPSLRERDANHNQFLPATEQHPHARGPFRAAPVAGNPNLTDLGVWNVFANPDFSASQRRIRRILCVDALTADLPGLSVPSAQADETIDRLIESAAFAGRCSEQALLPASVAVFKTPGLRDLGHSAPYMHNGQFDTLEQIVNFYRISSDLQRANRLRNGDRELADIRLTDQDVGALTAFLKALNEDYE